MARFLSDYGIVFILLVVAAYFSIATLAEQHPTDKAAAETLAKEVAATTPAAGQVLVVVGGTVEDAAFADALVAALRQGERVIVAEVRGSPSDARAALDRLARERTPLHAIATLHKTRDWAPLQDIARQFPSLGDVPVLAPHAYLWPNFLKIDNLRNITHQIAVIAIIAIGMTMVIITGGIDLSVGSLMALSSVLAALLIRDHLGGVQASTAGMVLASVAAILACGLIGLVSGLLITLFDTPAFIATLGLMLAAGGLAGRLTGGETVSNLPPGFIWLGRGATVAAIPNSVFLMALLYVAAHLFMTRTVLGRYLYAVGGNAEAARLSGVPVRRTIVFAYVVTGLLAGLGGVILASRLEGGSPNYGKTQELSVIAAVVVGGTSLSGGEGKMFGTLLGALLVGIIQNGLNLRGVTAFDQQIFLGGFILAAVLLDRLKKRWL